MKIRVHFHGGPIDDIAADMTWLAEVQMFTDRTNRIIYAYIRDETDYYYDDGMSRGLTLIYDKTLNTFRQNLIDIVIEDSQKGACNPPADGV